MFQKESPLFDDFFSKVNELSRNQDIVLPNAIEVETKYDNGNVKSVVKDDQRAEKLNKRRKKNKLNSLPDRLNNEFPNKKRKVVEKNK